MSMSRSLSTGFVNDALVIYELDEDDAVDGYERFEKDKRIERIYGVYVSWASLRGWSFE